MIKKLLLLVFLVVGVLGVSAQTISGTVADINGSVIANQQVYIVNNDSVNYYSTQTITNSLGVYSFNNVPNRATGFKVYVFDYQTQIQTINLAINSGTANFTIYTTQESCTAAFHSNPDSNNVNTIYFTDNSTGNPSTWAWDFGDGSSSNTQNPKHTYNASGTYTVTLNISGNSYSSSTNSTVVISNSTPTEFLLSGHILVNGMPLYQASAELYDVATNVLLNTVQVDSNDMYNFTNVSTGNYIIRATTNTIQGFAPTYYGDIVVWSTATQISVSSNLNNLDINLDSILVVHGSNSIGGTVVTGSKVGVDSLKVYLIDGNTNSIEESATTNTNGEYTFDNITDGTFNIWVEVIGKLSTPITITIDANNTNSNNNNFIMEANTITPSTLSINNNNIDGSISLYPNPVTDILNINLELKNESVIILEIYSISGKLISTQKNNVVSGNSVIKVSTNPLAQGSYLIIITDEANRTMKKLFIK